MDTIDKIKEKRIVIEGINNRYQIKKLVETREKKKRRGVTFPEEYLLHKKQWELLFSGKEDPFLPLLIRELERKIACYKQQDKEKNMFDFLSFITLEKVKNQLYSSSMKCFYCSCEVFLLYEMVRENKQWTLDRINNDLGHNEGNVVISCLECNLKRRRTNQDKFLFTKQLKIIKEEN
jgi:hypothetical protein